MREITAANLVAATSSAPVLDAVLHFVAALVVLGLLAWVITEAISWTREHTGPLATLAHRYARGEINRDEFYLRRADLLRTQRRGGGPPPVTPITPVAPVAPSVPTPVAATPAPVPPAAEPPHRPAAAPPPPPTPGA